MPVLLLNWLLCADPRVAPLWRSRRGSITPIFCWLTHADHRLAPKCRSVTLQGVVEIAACYWGGPYGCGAASAYITRLDGGSLLQTGEAGFLSYLFWGFQPDTGTWYGDALLNGYVRGVEAGGPGRQRAARI